MSDQRPNILWIYIEDQDPRYGCYGEPLVETPNIDALASEGVVFDRAYSPAPVCSPSRSALITGCYAIRNGTHVQRSSRFPGEEIYLPPGHRTVPELFRQAGYFTFNCGKDDYNFAYDRGSLYSTGNDDRKPDGKTSGGVSLQTGSGDWRECPSGTPFFAQIQTWGGKQGYTIESALDTMRKLGVDNPVAISPDDVTVPPQYPDIPEMRDLIVAQLTTMLISDLEVAAMISRLKASGHWGNTVVFLLSDHGAFFPRAKQMCYEEGLHVPLIVAAPGMAVLHDRITPGSRRGEQAATLDVSATSLELASIEVPDYMDTVSLFGDSPREHVFSARDRCEWVVDRTRSLIDAQFHYIRNCMTDRPLAQMNYRSVWPVLVKTQAMYDAGSLTAAQALPFGPRPAEELYDLEADPHELINLAGNTAYGDTLASMRGLVDEWIEDTDDKGRYPDLEAALAITKQQFSSMCTDPVFDDV